MRQKYESTELVSPGTGNRNIWYLWEPNAGVLDLMKVSGDLSWGSKRIWFQIRHSFKNLGSSKSGAFKMWPKIKKKKNLLERDNKEHAVALRNRKKISSENWKLQTYKDASWSINFYSCIIKIWDKIKYECESW
jgi:hypothetical protein